MAFPRETKNKGTIWSCNPVILWYMLQTKHISRQSFNSKRYVHPCVHSSTIHNSQDIETTFMSTDRWIDKKDMVHTHNGICSAIKKWNDATFSNMDEPERLSYEWSQKDKDKHHMTSLTCEIYNVTQWTYLWNRNRLIDIENRLVVAKVAVGVWGGENELGV